MSVSVAAIVLPAQAFPETERLPQVGRGRLGLFGGWSLEYAGRHEVFASAAQRLVAYIALRGSAARAEVAGTLWPEVSDSHANGSLRSTMWRLHRQRPQLVHDVGGTLSLSPTVTVDAVEFAAAARQLIGVHTALPAPPMTARSVGDLLPGWYDDWVVYERERFRQLRLHALEVLASALSKQRRHAEALDVALDAVSSEPLRESAHRTIVSIHLAEGNAAEALRAYRACRRLLAHELGVAPSPTLRQLMADAGIRDVDD